MLIDKNTFRRLIGYLKANSDLLHPGNHGDRGDPHGQLNHKYRGMRTINSDTSTGWTKLLNIKQVKNNSNAAYFYHVELFPDYSFNMETFDLYIFIKIVNGVTTITSYLQPRMHNKDYMLSRTNACYNINIDDVSSLDVDFYVQLNRNYMSFNAEIQRAQNSSAWFIKDRTALDNITLLENQPLIAKTAIPSPIDIQKNIGYSPAYSGTHDAGEYLQNAVVNVGDPIGWLCTETGTPGTWIVVGQQGVKSGSTAERPTGTEMLFPGYMYLDTTLGANGKPIWYTGSVWVDATGAVV